MFKLISFQGFSGLAVNALERIEKVLAPLGLEKTEKYDDADELLDAIVDSIDKGDTVAVTAEEKDYNSVKMQIMSTFSLSEEENREIRDIISKSSHGTDSTDELEEHCLVPSDGDVYITDDGFYSGFCVEFSNGARLIFFPLDEDKFGEIRGYIENEMMPDRAPDYEDEYFGSDEGEEETDEAFDSGIFAAMVAREKAEMGTEIPEYNDAETEENAEEGKDIYSEETAEETAEEESSEETGEEGDAEENTEEAVEEQTEEADEDGEQSEEDNPADETPLSEEENSEGIPENAEDEEGEEPDDEEAKEATEEVRSEADEDLSADEKVEEIDLTGFEEALSSAEKAMEALSRIDKRVAYIAGETSPIMLAMENEIDDLSTCFTVCEANIENEDALEVQVAMAKKTRLAIEQNDVDYAAAVSPVITAEKDGKEFYYSYIVFHDGVSAKAKKVSTATKQGIDSLIPHAFAVMFGLTERKAIHVSQLESDEIVETEDDEKKKKVLMLTVCIAAAVVAIASAIIMVWSYFRRTPEILITTNPYDTNPSNTSSSTPSPTINDNTSVPITDPQFNYPAEPTAGDISNVPSSTPFSSTKGNFTFTVYGYGHGVGMSQTGADYYANMGKSYLEILSIYYYGATLVLGDTAPETVKFGGNEYTLRDYLATAVESEMGESYSTEALKAQTVAIYTFAKYYNFDVPSTLHAFDKKPSKAAYAAVDVVAGQYMIYNGEVIKPYFHATSAGKTTSYSNAFGDSHIPYLAGGRPSYGDVNANNYCTTVTYTSEELNSLIYSKTGTSLSGDPANWIKILSHDGCIDQSTGYVSKIQVGEQIYTGYDFRMKVLGGALRSHCFTFIYTPTA